MPSDYKIIDEIVRSFVETGDAETENKPVGLLFKYARKELRLSQQELADLVSVKVNSISKYEKAGTPNGQFPPLPVLSKLVATLKLDPRIVLCAASDDRKDRMQLLGDSLNPVAKMSMDLSEFLELARPHLSEFFGIFTETFKDTGLAKKMGQEIEAEILGRIGSEDDLPSPPSPDPKPTKPNLENDDGHASE